MTNEQPRLRIVRNEEEPTWRPLAGVGVLDVTQLNETGSSRGADALSTAEQLDTMYGPDGWRHDTTAFEEANSTAPRDRHLGHLMVTQAAEEDYDARVAAGEALPATFAERMTAQQSLYEADQENARAALSEPRE